MIRLFVQLTLLLIRLLKILYRQIAETASPLNPPPHAHHRISRPAQDLKPTYDVVVIGSGYGGSIAASRMSRASPRQRVCVLERGLERWPGEFPEGVRTAIPELRFTGHFLGRIPIRIGKPMGLYHWILGRASSVFVGNGLGGTSLVNAGVWSRPEMRVLESGAWPVEIRRSPSALEQYFERAERMLEPDVCPEKVVKFDVLKEQADAVGLKARCEKVPLMTSFEDRTNSAGVSMKRSKMSGQDCMGLNDGSKNTTLVTYLADAERWGAEIFCGCEVTHIAQHPEGGYRVYYKRLLNDDPGLGDNCNAVRWVHAKRFVFFGAGSIGTTEILLRSKEYGLPLSPQAGSGMTNNGSMLAFGYDLDQRVNSLGRSRPSREPPGPSITGMVDCRNAKALEQGFVIQEGNFPSVMASLFRLVHWLLPTVKPFGLSWWKTKLKRLGRDALQYSQVYLVLGHDNSGARMSLKNGEPLLDMQSVRDFGHLAAARDILIRMTHALGGSFKSQGIRICVHPLGSMAMASDGTGSTGATVHTGQVLAGKDSIVHEGLIVVDGAVIPTSLGANPVATIAALAERSVGLLAKKEGLEINLTSLKPPQEVKQPSNDEAVVFSEVMEGHLLDSSTPITLAMTIHVRQCLERSQGSVTGTMRCPMLSKDLFNVEEGRFRLFEPDDGVSVAKKMVYDLRLVSSTGLKLFFHGEKTLSPAVAFSPTRAWKATTTLVATIRAADGSIEARATLQLSPTNLLRQLRSLRVISPVRTKQRQLLWDFLSSFVSNVAELMFVPLAPLQYPKGASVDPTSNRLTRIAVDAHHIVQAKDGFCTPLRMWYSSVPSNGKDLLFVPGGAVTHEIYALSTVHKNAIEHFTSLGYRCWCVTHRAATVEAEDRRHCWTTYDVRLDIEAALRTIRALNGKRPVFVLAHCVGSGAFASGLLDGTIPSHWVRGIVASQFFLHPLVSPLNQWKARLPLISLYRMLAGDWYACDLRGDEGFVQRLLNQALRFYPHTSRDELCRSNLCHRTDLPFGRLWNHANLNKETHDRLHELFSGVNTNCIEHLANMGLKGVLTDNEGRSLVTEDSIQRLKGIPVLLMYGKDNQVYQPGATQLTLQLLAANFGHDSVKRVVFEGLGHLDCWMSDAAAAPGGVFEAVEKELLEMEYPPSFAQTGR